jgi:hypothetical protein
MCLEVVNLLFLTTRFLSATASNCQGYCFVMQGAAREHAPKVEFLGSKTAFKEESWFLIATTCWRLLILEQDMMNMSFIWAV